MMSFPYEYIGNSIVWTVIFLGYFGIMHYILKPRNIAYTQRPKLFFLFSLTLMTIAGLLWRNLFWDYFTQNSFQLLFMTIMIIVMYPMALLLLRQYRKMPDFKGFENHEFEGLRVKSSYAATKGIEVLFQDICILAIFLITRKFFPDVMQQSMALLMVFGGSHLCAFLITSNKLVSSLIVILAAFFGFIIPIILNSLPFGFIIIFATHYLFYLVLTPAAFVATRRLGYLQEI